MREAEAAPMLRPAGTALPAAARAAGSADLNMEQEIRQRQRLIREALFGVRGRHPVELWPSDIIPILVVKTHYTGDDHRN